MRPNQPRTLFLTVSSRIEKDQTVVANYDPTGEDDARTIQGVKGHDAASVSFSTSS